MTSLPPRAFSSSLRGRMARRRQAKMPVQVLAPGADDVAPVPPPIPVSAIVFPHARIDNRNGAYIYVEDDGNALRRVLRRLGQSL